MTKPEVGTKPGPGKAEKPSFNAVVKSWIPAMERVLPKHLTGERMFTLLNLLANKSEALRECMDTRGGQVSLYTAVMNAAKIGLEIGQHAHIVPFRNSKRGIMEAVCIPDYRGLIHLMVSSGKVRHLDVRVVYVEDEFDYGLGDTPFIKHKPKLGSKKRAPEDIVAVYTIANMTDGTKVIGTPMSKDEVDAIRRRSRAKDDGPWVTDYEAMAKKTVVKRDAKFLPQTPELQAAVELDNRAETGEVGVVSDLIDTDESLNRDVAANTKEKLNELKEKMGGGEAAGTTEGTPQGAEEPVASSPAPSPVPATEAPAPAATGKGKPAKQPF